MLTLPLMLALVQLRGPVTMADVLLALVDKLPAIIGAVAGVIAAVAAVIGAAKGMQTGREVGVLKTQTNGIIAERIALAHAAGHAEGVQAGAQSARSESRMDLGIEKQAARDLAGAAIGAQALLARTAVTDAAALAAAGPVAPAGPPVTSQEIVRGLL